jgi:hypothetical protein
MTTTAWVDHLVDARGIRAIYGDTPPTLQGVDVLELILNHDGPRAELRIDLADYPRHPPAKWAAGGCNVVQVNLVLIDVTTLSVHGWTTDVELNLTLERHGDAVRLTTAPGDPVELDVTAGFAHLARISAYQDTDR